MESLRRYVGRAIYVQRTLFHMFTVTQTFDEPRLDIIQVSWLCSCRFIIHTHKRTHASTHAHTHIYTCTHTLKCTYVFDGSAKFNGIDVGRWKVLVSYCKCNPQENLKSMEEKKIYIYTMSYHTIRNMNNFARGLTLLCI